MNEITIKQKKLKQLKIFILNILMVLASLFVFLQNGTTNNIIGIMGLTFFGLCLIFNLYGLLSSRDILIINEHGFTDNSTIWSIGFVSWEHVSNILTTSVMNTKYITVKLKDFDNMNISSIKKWMLSINGIGYKKINISLQATDTKIDDVLKSMQEYFSKSNLINKL